MAHLQAPIKGLTIIYTGEGKGKTTAAMGLALRAAGYGKRVCIVQFVKVWFTGELKGFESVPGVEFIQAGKGFYQILGDQKDPAEHKAAAEEALRLSRKKIESGLFEVVVLDEIIGAAVGGLIEPAALVELVRGKPEALDLVLTGRHAETIVGLVELADLVTEMKKVKHPYDSGILAKKGIDF